MGFKDNSLLATIEFIGNADTAMLISLLVAIIQWDWQEIFQSKA